ncbi:MAG: glycosyltransferase family 2 protein [Haliscomenobacter sp.]|nr:glycosyltransferase family 2 protein [Haliscomenobacter sp.]
MVKISLVVMTLNEAHNIRRCLESSIGIADELLVVDSLSTDDTVAISESLGARVILQPFLGFMEQRQFAINHAAHPFILILDADEVLSEQLRQSILQAKAHWTHDCYYMNRLSNIGDQWIRHGGWYPDRKMRLFDRTQFAVEGINPHDKLVPVKGARSTHLKGDMLHYTNSDIESRVKPSITSSTWPPKRSTSAASAAPGCACSSSPSSASSWNTSCGGGLWMGSMGLLLRLRRRSMCF